MRPSLTACVALASLAGPARGGEPPAGVCPEGASGARPARPTLPGHAAEAAPPEIAATVAGAPVYTREIEAYVNRKIPRTTYHRRVSEEKRDVLRREALEKIVVEILAAREGERRGLDVAAEVDGKIAETRRSLAERNAKGGKSAKSAKSGKGGKRGKGKTPGHPTSLEAALESAGRTLADFRAGLRREALAAAVEEADVTSKVKVTDEAVRKYYDDRRSLYSRPEAVRLKHFLVKVKPWVSPQEREKSGRLAAKAVSEIRGGGTFEEVAKRHAGQAPKGIEAGEGFVHRGGLMPQIEDAVFKLEPGTLGAPIRSLYGFHVVEVLEKKPARPMAFDEVRDAVRKRAEGEMRDRLRKAWVLGLKEGAEVKVLWRRLLPPAREGMATDEHR